MSNLILSALFCIYYNLLHGGWLRQYRISVDDVTTLVHLTQVSQDMSVPSLFSPFCITTCYMVDGYDNKELVLMMLRL